MAILPVLRLTEVTMTARKFVAFGRKHTGISRIRLTALTIYVKAGLLRRQFIKAINFGPSHDSYDGNPA